MEYFVSNICSEPSKFCLKRGSFHLFRKVLFEDGTMMACLVKARHGQTFPAEDEHPVTILEGITNGRAMVEIPLEILESIDFTHIPYHNEMASHTEVLYIQS